MTNALENSSRDTAAIKRLDTIATNAVGRKDKFKVLRRGKQTRNVKGGLEPETRSCGLCHGIGYRSTMNARSAETSRGSVRPAPPIEEQP